MRARSDAEGERRDERASFGTGAVASRIDAGGIGERHREGLREGSRDAGRPGVAPNRRDLPVAGEASMSPRAP